jgi:hypothetical protein
VPGSGFGAQVRDIVRRLHTLTRMPPLAVDLMRDDFGVPVSFVVAPGLGTRPSI